VWTIISRYVPAPDDGDRLEEAWNSTTPSAAHDHLNRNQNERQAKSLMGQLQPYHKNHPK